MKMIVWSHSETPEWALIIGITLWVSTVVWAVVSRWYFKDRRK